jgi:hypothetical protein
MNIEVWKESERAGCSIIPGEYEAEGIHRDGHPEVDGRVPLRTG